MKCSNIKCNTGLAPRWQPVMLLWPENYTRMQCQPVSVTLNKHLVCDICQKTIGPHNLIPKEEFEQIQATVLYHGKQKPSSKTAKLEFFVPDTFKTGLAGEVTA